MNVDPIKPEGFSGLKGLTPIFEWMHRMATANPSEAASFPIDPVLISSPASRSELIQRVAKLSQMLGLDVRVVTAEDDPEYGRIKIVRAE